VNAYIQKKKRKDAKRAENTKKSYNRHLETVKKVIGDRPALEVTRPELIKKFEIENLHYRTPTECHQLCVQLHGIFKMVQHDFALPHNIAANLTFNFQRRSDFSEVRHAPPMDYRDYPAFIKACHDYKVRSGEGKGTRPDISFFTEMLFL